MYASVKGKTIATQTRSHVGAQNRVKTAATRPPKVRTVPTNMKKKYDAMK